MFAVENAIEWVQIHEEDKTISTNNSKREVVLLWTADAIDLLEMAMSLHERGAINNGDIPITTVVNLFFNLFNLKPGNFFSTYGVMRTRAKSRTQFLDELKKSLERKMDKDDNKEIRRK